MRFSALAGSGDNVSYFKLDEWRIHLNPKSPPIFAKTYP